MNFGDPYRVKEWDSVGALRNLRALVDHPVPLWQFIEERQRAFEEWFKRDLEKSNPFRLPQPEPLTGLTLEPPVNPIKENQ